MCPKSKLFKGYIDLEIQLREVKRCRILYEKYLKFSPANSAAWVQVSIQIVFQWLVRHIISADNLYNQNVQNKKFESQAFGCLSGRETYFKFVSFPLEVLQTAPTVVLLICMLQVAFCYSYIEQTSIIMESVHHDVNALHDSMNKFSTKSSFF